MLRFVAKWGAIIEMAALDPAIFLTLGHGEDDVDVKFESRMVLPEGFTLVTLAQCGVVTKGESVHPMMDAFTNPAMKDVLQDPLANKEAISGLVGGIPIYIYRPGDLIPDLSLHLLLEWIKKSEKKMYVQQSGVYKFPVLDGFDLGGAPGAEGPDAKLNLKFKYIPVTWGWEKPNNFINKDEVINLYKNSLFPTQDEVNGILDANNMEFKKVKKATTYNLSTVFERLGPGVYYFVVCRSIKDNDSGIGNFTREIMAYNKNNENTHTNSVPKKFLNNHYNEFKTIRDLSKESVDKVKYYPSIFPYVLFGAEKLRKDAFTKPENFLTHRWSSHYLNDPRFIKRHFRNVTRLRRKSLIQQEKYVAGAVAGEDADAGAAPVPVGGAGGPPALLLPTNFKNLNNDSSLEEVISELPHLKMRGIDDSKLLRDYEAMMIRYPQYREEIKNDMYRVVMGSLNDVFTNSIGLSNEEKKLNLDLRLDTIMSVYGPHGRYKKLVEAAGKFVTQKKAGMRGGTRRRRHTRRIRKQTV